MTKICTKCKKEKKLEEFHKHPSGQFGRHPRCMECRREEKRIEYKKNSEYYKIKSSEYFKNNKEKILDKNKIRYEEKKEKYLSRQKEYYIENKNKKIEYQREYYHSHKEEQRERVHQKRKDGKFKSIDANHRHKRRALCKNTDITNEWLKELRENSIICPLCGKEMKDLSLFYHPDQKQLDHIAPLNTGGMHTKDNVRFICGNCNNTRPKDGSDVKN